MSKMVMIDKYGLIVTDLEQIGDSPFYQVPYDTWGRICTYLDEGDELKVERIDEEEETEGVMPNEHYL